jgi:hypothetical protein
LHERRDASDFYTKTQDKARSRELTVLPRTNNNLDRLNIERSSTMSLDAAVAPETLTTTLHYLTRGAEKPAAYRIQPPPGVSRWNGTDDPREVTIEDARGREAEFTLDRNGFALVKASTGPISMIPRRSNGSTTQRWSSC